MGMAGQLEVVAHAVTAMLATWLGLTVALRAPRQRGARPFGALAVLLVAWSGSIIVRRLTADPAVDEVGRWIEVAGSSLLPPAVLTVVMALTVERHPPGWMRVLLGGFWAISIAVTILTVVAPDLEPRIAAPHLTLPGVSGELVGWSWIGLRIGIFAWALVWIGLALRDAGADRARRTQLRVTWLALLVGTAGGVARIAPTLSDADPWIGVWLVALSMVLVVYAVFAQGIFFAPEVAARAFRYAVVVGLGVTAYVVALIALDGVVRRALAIDVPIVIGLALVATVALVEPIAARVRRLIAGPDEGDPAYDRLLRALGEGVLTTQRPEDSIQPALDRLVRSMGLSGASAAAADGAPIAASGTPPAAGASLEMPLERDATSYGSVAFGSKESGLPYTPREREVLAMASGYLAASLELSARQDAQARSLERLSRERAALRSSGTELHGALTASREATGPGLHVYALGPLRAERDGQLIRQWGGEKAGTRQAEALFAFLFDRGERGVTKDEAIELIWPDVDLDRADLAFHRTLGGLRRTLEPGRGQREGSKAIAFSNDRYRLDPSVVGWSDVATFEERLGQATAATGNAEALRALAEARALYRGEYLDDCPFYGDGSQVEDRRELLRGRYVDLLLAVGAIPEERGDRAAAAAAFREARLAADDTCPPADEALRRLGVT
jgi:DNA-binding SARP family transcriptional activator